ncbi:putative hydroxypyruvate isomerase [Haliotis rubra]|uniref:putative hydroxypyruvate isomerase n=1 Tax=Haliotis rubra TaxID=36100 RepID=UPI001EE5B280|nr:putative hydroxypyruvate isomerase [Haliotis rubra]
MLPAKKTFGFTVAALRTLHRSTSSMPLKIAANVSLLFKETPNLADRYQVAKDAGFKFVECTFPYDVPVDQMAAAREGAGLEQVLINGYPGDLANGDLGLAALPSRKEEFREKLELSIQYANALECKRMHLMAGRRGQVDDKVMEETFLDNLQYAADRLQKEGILAVIEPVNNRISVPDYFLYDPHKGLEYVKRLNHPNLKLQFDVFHVQIMDGNLTKNLKEMFPYIGHIQISQVPERHEPDSPGEINYPYVFQVLENLGYDGYIGLEYNPKGDTLAGLEGLRKLGLL